MMAATSLEEFAQKLVQARRTREHLSAAVGTACASAADAYKIQARVASLLNADVAGWKVGIHSDGIALAAPIFESDLVGQSEAFVLGGDLASVKVEVELALRLGSDLPARAGETYTASDILAASAEIFCGIELVANRFVPDADISFAMRLADNFSHAGYAVGAGVAEFSGLDLTRLRCIVRRDRYLAADVAGGHPLGDPLLPVVAWANAQCDELGGLRAGQFVTTGTLIEPFTLDSAATIEGELQAVGAAVMRVELA